MAKNQFNVNLNLNSALKGAKNGHIEFTGSNYIYRVEVGTICSNLEKIFVEI